MVMSGVPASDGRWTRARPASHVWSASVDVPRGRAGTRTRSKALHQSSTIGRLAADRAGARPISINLRIALFPGCFTLGAEWNHSSLMSRGK